MRALCALHARIVMVNDMHDQDIDCWTPKLAGEVMVEAARWALTYGGPAGPASIRSSMPELAMDWIDRMAQGWESVASQEPTKKRRNYWPAEVSQFERAIMWPLEYLADHDGLARVLQLWLRCKITKQKFGAAVDEKKWSRATAYRNRDKALSIIAQGLHAAGVAVPK